MLLGNNIVNWLMCPLHVDVISALRNIKPWYLTNLFSVGQVTSALRAEVRFPILGRVTKGQAQQRCSASFAGFGYEIVEHSPVPNVQFAYLS